MGKKTGALIKEARTAAKLTQEQLAKNIPGITASDISKAERGEAELTQAVLKQIAKLTGVTQASLLNAEKDTDAKTTGAKSTAKTSEKTAAAKTEAKTAAKTTAAKSESKTAAKTTAKSDSKAKSTASTAKTSSTKTKSEEKELTATEKKLVELYRAADSETKKAAMSLLKGEKSDIQQILTGLLGDSLAKFLK